MVAPAVSGRLGARARACRDAKAEPGLLFAHSRAELALVTPLGRAQSSESLLSGYAWLCPGVQEGAIPEDRLARSLTNWVVLSSDIYFNLLSMYFVPARCLGHSS